MVISLEINSLVTEVVVEDETIDLSVKFAEILGTQLISVTIGIIKNLFQILTPTEETTSITVQTTIIESLLQLL